MSVQRPGAYIEQISAAVREDLRRQVRDLDGLLVGELTARELVTFEAAVDAGVAYRAYERGAGFMGLAKVRMRNG